MAGPNRSGVTVEGAAETRRAFRRAADRADRIDREDEDAARVVERDAVRRVPVDSGALRATIRVVEVMDAAAVIAGSDVVPYAGVIHHGWPARGIAAQPYLDDRRRDEVAEFYEDEVRDLVRQFDRDA